jgi:transposase
MAPVEVVGFLEGLGAVRAVYEAGPTGFGLARAARERGIDVRVAAPGSIPRVPGDRVKTDRRDAIRLARLLAAGELGFAFVPSVEDEAFRDLVRVIEDVRGDLMRARHRLSKLLLRRGERYPGTAWTLAHLSAPSWATGADSPSPPACRGSSASSPPSTPPTASAARARSPRPAPATPAACWSRPPSTTARRRASARHSRAAKPARTRV